MVRTIPIHFNTPDYVLEGILDKIDGVHFTGGGLDLYNFTTQEWHPYYKTAKHIFQYATRPSGRKFLLTGICQGLEVLTTLAAEDDADLLRKLSRGDVQRPVTWQWNTTDQIKQQSKLFADFDPKLLLDM